MIGYAVSRQYSVWRRVLDKQCLSVKQLMKDVINKSERIDNRLNIIA